MHECASHTCACACTYVNLHVSTHARGCVSVKLPACTHAHRENSQNVSKELAGDLYEAISGTAQVAPARHYHVLGETDGRGLVSFGFLTPCQPSENAARTPKHPHLPHIF